MVSSSVVARFARICKARSLHLPRTLRSYSIGLSVAGWNFTRLSDVIMQRQSPTGNVLNSVTLVTTNGCLNPTMRAISPLAPVSESPLNYRLAFRAAMFQGMRSGDEMVMRVRIVGCVDRRECAVVSCRSTCLLLYKNT